MSATRTRRNASANVKRSTAAKAEVESARSEGRVTDLDAIAKVVDQHGFSASQDGYTVATVATGKSGSKFLASCAAVTRENGSTVKGNLPPAAVALIAAHADAIASSCDALDKALNIGKYLPADDKAAPAATLDMDSMSDDELRAAAAAILAKLKG